MAYIVQADLKGHVPDEWVESAMDDALDDDEGDTGVWDAISTAVDEDIDGRLAPRYGPAVSPVPASIKAAARAIASVMLWRRYGTADAKNPWAEAAKYWQDKLDAIGRGEQDLESVTDAQATDGAILEDMRTYSENGTAMV